MTTSRSLFRSASSADAPTEQPLAFPPFTRARRVRAELVTGILRSGRLVPDDTFDEVYPEPVRGVSSVHWTPVRVAARVVELLRLRRGERVLDVGAGVGKFCVVAAAMSEARVRGVERQPPLAVVACEAARRYGVEVDFVEGSFTDEEPQAFDAAYLFNPFVEAILLPGLHDYAADRFAGRIAADIDGAERFLRQMRVGARVVTFCGFGGDLPPEFVQVSTETWDGGELALWEKR